MKSVLVLRHVPHETLGTLQEHLAEAGLPWHYVDLYQQVPAALDLDAAAGLIVLGGPMNVDEVQQYPFLKPECEWIRAAIERQLPTLGICLGAQLIAKALGARVFPNGIKEIGWYQLQLTPAAADDGLFSGSRSHETVFQWHGDTFDLPRGAIHLAESRLCRHQAFRYGASAYGLQFHIEMTPDMIEQWLDVAENRSELATLDYIDPEAIRQQTAEHFPAMEVLGQRILPRFVALCAARAQAAR